MYHPYLTALVQYITFTVITPDYFENITDFVVREGKMTLAETRDYFSINSYILRDFVATTVMGILTTADVAFFTRKKVRRIQALNIKDLQGFWKPWKPQKF